VVIVLAKNSELNNASPLVITYLRVQRCSQFSAAGDARHSEIDQRRLT